jgi:hypothetical protein
MSAETKTRGDALDLLEEEDLELRRLFAQMRTLLGPSVSDRADFGELVKTTIRHLATREAAITEVVGVTTEMPSLADVVARLEADTSTRRPMISQMEKMSRGVPPGSLSQGQDEVALPAMKAALRGTDQSQEMKSATHVAKHAPTNLHPRGPRWIERAPVISRLLSIYDRMRDYPRADHSS